jgi:hypothetical protein
MSVLPKGWRDEQGGGPETELMQLRRRLRAASRQGLATGLSSYLRLAKVTAVTAAAGFLLGFGVYLAVYLGVVSPMATLTQVLDCPGCEVARTVDAASDLEEELRSAPRQRGPRDPAPRHAIS